MFPRLRLAHAGPARPARPSIEVIGHQLALGLGVPIIFAIIGAAVGGFPAALIGFGAGLATCAVAAAIRIVATAE